MKSTGWEELEQELRKFVVEREWDQFHNPKNLAMLLASEVGELVAEFRWVDMNEAEALARGDSKGRVEDEIGDIGIALMLICSRMQIDLQEVIAKKLEHNRINYPAVTSRGRAERPDR